ncbi:hypothetical protein DICPUDRAFT_52123 [Dictyostelium purpureum]|uniref:VWFA domain-containing protein n=1 Tax=Dictyostelium purpureum TaxID=5786 RepID=F0Z738_DICPU|nr:uncharacterized protein DICPUDRAFT_52123 [Dictyostelium purpureum]EGC40269.1 hypothetical protein DICPUDRAFT_52123 [Dictyostelium purpureum]|eukprot:XP_003283205.1 hypothetical protein DICPUDRAFT_52123 [Dictyostelium purpureum]
MDIDYNNNEPLMVHDLNIDLFEANLIDKSVSIDGIIKGTIQIPVQQTKRKLLLIVLVDKSRSIQTAWFQIQSTLLNLFSIISNVEDQEIILEILFFNNICFRLEYNKDNFRELILKEKPNGKTCFASAFSLTEDIIKKYYRIGTGLKSDKDYDPETDTAIVLLTDGAHTTVRDHKKAFKDLRNTIDYVAKGSVVVSTMGFTENSRYNDLDGIRRLLGTSPGIYQYSDPSDGSFALQEKLTFILKYVIGSSSSKKLNIKLETIYNQIDNNDGLVEKTSNLFFNDSNFKSNEKSINLVLDKFGSSEINFNLNTNGYNIDSVKVHLDINGDSKYKQIIEIKPNIKNDSSIESKYYSKLIKLDSKINTILSEIEVYNQSNQPSDEIKKSYLEQFLNIKKDLDQIENNQLFKIKSSVRSDLVELKQQCQSMIDQLLELVNGWNRTSWSSVSNARVADITYRYLFKSTSRQRRLNLKVARNANVIKSEAQNFKELSLDIDSFEDLEEPQSTHFESSKQMFSDLLTLSDWTEALEEKDCMGFGLSIQRPECVVDDPTQIRIQEVSTTFICKSSIEDAIKLSLNVHGQERTTGGFQVGQDVQSVAVRGRGREPINSWLPLYINKEHWKPIKYQLKNIVAYFVTLDPLAFSFDQIDSLFLVLGNMISKNDIGERELLLIFQYIRTLRQIVIDLKALPRILSQLESILNKQIYYIQYQPKNLFVVTSYLLVLTQEELKPLFKSNSEYFKLWEHVLESSIRRACNSFFEKMEQVKIDSFLLNILYSSEEIATIESPDTKENEDFSTFYESLLNYKFNSIPNNDFEFEKLLNIKKKSFNDSDGNKSTNKIEPINKSITNTLITMSNLLENKGYPNITGLLNSLRFIHAFSSLNKDDKVFETIDSRFGIPPQEYIETIKQSIRVDYPNNGIGRFIDTIKSYYGIDNDQTTFSTPKTAEVLLNHLRTMILQAVSYRINKHATYAVVEKKRETDVFTNHIECYQYIQSDVLGRISSILRAIHQQLMFSAQTNAALKTSDIGEFAKTIPQCGNLYFPNFVHSIMNLERFPFGEQKFIIFLSNILVSTDNYGNIDTKAIVKSTWIPGRKYNKKFFKSFGIQKTIYLFQQAFFYKYLHESKNRDVADNIDRFQEIENELNFEYLRN